MNLIKKKKKIFFCQIDFFKSLYTIQITVVRQNILSVIMLKNVKPSYGNVRFYLARPEICWARNVCTLFIS